MTPTRGRDGCAAGRRAGPPAASTATEATATSAPASRWSATGSIQPHRSSRNHSAARRRSPYRSWAARIARQPATPTMHHPHSVAPPGRGTTSAPRTGQSSSRPDARASARTRQVHPGRPLGDLDEGGAVDRQQQRAHGDGARDRAAGGPGRPRAEQASRGIGPAGAAHLDGEARRVAEQQQEGDQEQRHQELGDLHAQHGRGVGRHPGAEGHQGDGDPGGEGHRPRPRPRASPSSQLPDAPLRRRPRRWRARRARSRRGARPWRARRATTAPRPQAASGGPCRGPVAPPRGRGRSVRDRAEARPSRRAHQQELDTGQPEERAAVARRGRGSRSSYGGGGVRAAPAPARAVTLAATSAP